MARSRVLKPEFFQDEDLALLSHGARLLFQGLWLLADRRGRLEDRPLKLKAHLFPYEGVDVDGLLDELTRRKVHGQGSFILRYTASDGRKYIQVNNFERHQKCHPKEPESQLPEPAAADREKPRQETARQEPAVCKPPDSVSSSSSTSGSDSTNNGASSLSSSPASVLPAYDPEPCSSDNGPDAVPEEQRQDYAEEVQQAFFKKTGQAERVLAHTEYAVLDGWMKQGIPLRIVLTAIEETKGIGLRLPYYNSSVVTEYVRVRLALSGTR